MSLPFFKRNFIIDRPCVEVIDFMKKSTFSYDSPTRFSDYRHKRKYEFEGWVWENGFCVYENSVFRNSFAPEARAVILPVGDTQSSVRLEVGLYSIGAVGAIIVIIALIVTLIAIVMRVSERGFDKEDAGLLFIVLLFGSVLFLFLRFGFYSGYKRLKSRILEVLDYPEGQQGVNL